MTMLEIHPDDANTSADKVLPVGVAFVIPPEFDPSDDTPPVIPAVTVSPSSGTLCAKDGCTNYVTKPAKGPSPKYCDDHRGTRSRANSTAPRSSTSGWKRAGEVESALNNLISYVGLAVTFVNEVDGTTITKGGPKLARELVLLGTSDMRLRRYLELLASPGKYGGLAMAALAMVVPILANHGMLPQIVLTVMNPTDPSPATK